MKHKNNGFTIVEVALVLAVAGMIFAITLAVLPTLWANERDAARRDDIMRFVAQVKSFQTNNNRGALPTPNSSNDKTEFGNSLDETYNINTPPYNISAEEKDTSWGGFYRDYFDRDFLDPNGDPYKLRIMFCKQDERGKTCNNSALNNNPLDSGSLGNISGPRINNNIYVVISAVCDGDTPVKSANSRRVAAVYRLEHAGQYCYND